VIPKNSWPDGSLKFALVSGSANFTANTEKRILFQVTNSPTAVSPTLTLEDLLKVQGNVQIIFDTFGTATWSGDDWKSPFETWVSGSEMSSWIYRKPI
jgi:hypothetical protein